MPFLAPLALLGLLGVPAILALYMLRLRRTERTVSSTLLWQRLTRDVEANAPWQRLRRSLLLLIQLLLAVALALMAAQPFLERPAGLARDLVMVIDASASMAASDVFPDRLSAAKRAAVEALRDLPGGARVSVVAAAGTAQVVANEATDVIRIRRAIEGITQTSGPAAMDDALKLAGELAARARGAEVLVVTDDASSDVPAVKLEVPLRVIPIGRERANQAILALSVRAAASGLERSAFVSVGNFAGEQVTRGLQILADGAPVTARDLVLQPVSRAEVVINEIPAGTRIVEARLGPPAGTPAGNGMGATDRLSRDDVAWAVAPTDRLVQVLLVGDGNVYLQNALTLLPNVELYGATSAEYPPSRLEDFDLVVFDGFLPARLPNKPILAIAPPASSPLGTVTGVLTAPAVGDPPPDEPLVRDVDLSRLHVARAQKIALPEWARTVIPGPDGAPLLYAGRRGALPSAVIAFDLRQSDLPLEVAWPILVSNLAGELLELHPATAAPLAPGTPIDLVLPPGATELRVSKPDGSVVSLVPGVSGASSVTFGATDQLGVYRAEPIVPVASGSASSVSPSATASATAGAATGPDGATLFVVDLFDPTESNITPGDGTRLERLGGARDASVEPGLARDEWWFPLALLALVLLLGEWLIYERDGARRIWSLIRDRVRRVRPLRRAA